MTHTQFIIFLFTFLTAFGAGFCCEIGVGGAVSLSGPLASLGIQAANGFTFWAEEMNKIGGINVNGTLCRINLTLYDHRDSPSIAEPIYDRLGNDSNIDILIADGRSSITPTAAAAAKKYNKLFISPGTVPSDILNGYAFSIAPSYYSHLVVVPFFRIKDIKSISLLYNPEATNECVLVEEQAKELGINITKLPLVEFERRDNSTAPFEDWNPELRQNYSLAVKEMIELNSDAIISCIQFPRPNNYILQLMRDEHKYTPKMFVGRGSYLDYLDAEFLPFQISLEQYFPYANFEDAKLLVNMQLSQLREGFLNRFGDEISHFSMNAIIAGQVIDEIVSKTPSLDTDELIQALVRLKLPTYVGKISFDVENQQQREMIMTQYVNESKAEVIAPVSAQTIEIIFPMPTWEEREPAELGDDAAEIALLVFVVVFMSISLVFIGIVIVKWNHKVIKAASPPFLLVVLIGSLLLYGSAFTFIPHLITEFGCNFRYWLVGIGWVFLYVSLFARTWRLKVLFSNKTVEIINVSDKKLWLIISVLLLIQMILVAIGQAVVQQEKEIEQPDEYRRSEDYIHCTASYGNWATYIPTVLAAIFDGAIILFGVYLSIAVRKIRYSLYNETKVLMFSMYNLALFALIVFLFQTEAIKIEHRGKYISTVVFLVLGVGSTVIAVMGQKIYFMFLNKDMFQTQHSVTSKGSTTRGTSQTHGVSDLPARIEKLEKELEETQIELERSQLEVKKWKKRAKARESTESEEEESSEDLVMTAIESM